MPAILGKKVGMTSIYDDQGRQVPVTVIEAGPCQVLQVKSVQSDGYNAVQLGFAEKPGWPPTGCRTAWADPSPFCACGRPERTSEFKRLSRA